jgi:GAF domain-containing protein
VTFFKKGKKYMSLPSDVNLEQLFSGLRERKAKLQKLCNYLRNEVEHYDWVGFYIVGPDKKVLKLGPFAGEPTEHKVIPFGKGVCGQSAEKEEMIVVPDVKKLDNYLSCSINVQSEIVVPVYRNGKYVAQLDIDSHQQAPFTEKDQTFLKNICSQIGELFPVT